MLLEKTAKFTVFLDRDGVINVDSPDYIKSAEEFEFIPKSAEAIALLTQKCFDVIVITNQSGVGRKIFTRQALDAIFDKMKKGVADAGGAIKDIFFCPHTPEDGCSCRKPLPGLLFQAIQKYGIDPVCSCMIGDSIKDIECAQNAGCGYSVLVRTGNGKKSEKKLREKNVRKPDFTADDLMDAVRWLNFIE
ncbi:MAG: D-glycero-beta-D-manno-heptose 1,7-bisphosphate 7-phosphatase [Desulfamplus sp.]|nr:D-glycero-beta-D-manno-heptose 1,7-bisphosphate 7-phosphatase [Desulfamplus sp.]